MSGFKTRPKKSKKDSISLINAYIKQNLVKALLNDAFPKQREFIELNKPNRLKALLASRRFGKSHTACLYLIITALKHPETLSLYIGLTRATAQLVIEIYFRPILRRFNIQYEENLTTLTFKFENGSLIKFFGMDSSKKDHDKLRGPKYKLATIDEAQDYTTDLRNLVYNVLKPATTDNQGTICLFGTPKETVLLENPDLFYSVTNNMEKNYEWSVFNGNTVDNPHMREVWQAELDTLLKFNPDFKNDPRYQREYEGKWVLSDDKKIYHYSSIKNICSELPQLNSKWMYLCGLDFGFNDPSAFVVVAYNAYSRNLYIVEVFKKGEMTIDDIQDKLVQLNNKYKFIKIICDHSKQLVETLRQRLHYNFVSAEKNDKFDHISMFNDDLRAGKIKLLPGTDELKKEWDNLIYDTKADKLKELDSCQNHCFIAGTKISTNKGLINIEDINQSHLILTREGFKPVLIATETGIKQTYKLTTESGRELIGSSDHPIFVNDKWIELSKLKTGDILTCISNHQELTCQIKMEKVLKSSIKELNSEDIQIQTAEHIEYILNPPTDKDYIDLFMKKISDQFQKVTMFIIKMKILLIMTYLILKLLLLQSMQECTVLKDGKIQNIKIKLLNNYYQLMILQKSGILQKKENNGIVKMQRKPGLKEQCLNYLVKFVINLLNPNIKMLNCVEMLVMQKNEETPELMMKLDLAQNAKQNFQQTNIINRDFVQDRVLDVTILNEQKVYNLSVADKPEYFANGILVHNCSDSALYAWRYARHYLGKELINTDKPTDPMHAQVLSQFKKKQQQVNKTQAELDFDSEYGYDY